MRCVSFCSELFLLYLFLSKTCISFASVCDLDEKTGADIRHIVWLGAGASCHLVYLGSDIYILVYLGSDICLFVYLRSDIFHLI